MTFRKGQSGNPGGQNSPRTNRARMAIANFVDQNADKLQVWLDDIALKDGSKAAFQCFIDVVEYNIPKLARTELTGKDGGSLFDTMDDATLAARYKMLMESGGE